MRVVERQSIRISASETPLTASHMQVMAFFSQGRLAGRHRIDMASALGAKVTNSSNQPRAVFVADLITSLVNFATLASNYDLRRMQYWQAFSAAKVTQFDPLDWPRIS